MDPPAFFFSGGGTGGHLYPGLAVASAVRELSPEARITFLTTLRQLDRDLLARTDFEKIPQAVQPLTSKPWRWPALWLAWRRSVAEATTLLRARRPAAVLGLGGYAAAPPVVAARRLGIRTAILNPDAVPGKANRLLAKYADLIVLQWGASRRHFPANAPCEALGCPIRAAFTHADPQVARTALGLDATRPLLLVTAGSLGARTVNDALIEAWPTFWRTHREWRLVHVTGQADEERVRAAYLATETPAQVLAFTHDMPHVLAAADLVVARAGASTLAELTALGKPAILFPYPYHKDRHQHANAQVLVDAGAAVCIEDTKDGGQNAAVLAPALGRLSDAAARGAMGRAAGKLGRPDAARAVAQWLTDLSAQCPKND